METVVLLLDPRQHFINQHSNKIRKHPWTKVACRAAGVPIAERVDHDHRLSLALVDQVVERDVGPANLDPGIGLVAKAVQQEEDGIGSLPLWIVIGRSVHEEVTVVVGHGGMIEVVRDGATRAIRLARPRQRPRYEHSSAGRCGRTA